MHGTSLASLALLAFLVVAYHGEGSSAFCCARNTRTNLFSCCGMGKCNIFCCNCDGDTCKKTTRSCTFFGLVCVTGCDEGIAGDQVSNDARLLDELMQHDQTLGMFQNIDRNSDGKLTYQETVSILVQDGGKAAELDATRGVWWNEMDKDNNGWLTPGEFDRNLA